MNIVRPTGTNWLTLPIIMLVIPLGAAHVSTVAPFINEMSADLDVSVSLAGQLGTAQFIGALVSALALIPFISRIQLRQALFWSAAVLAVSTFVTGLGMSFAVMFAARVVAGLAAGIAMAGAYAAMGRAWPEADERNKKMGFLVAALSGGPGVLAPIMRLVAEPTSWQVATIAFAIFVGLIALLVLVALPRLEGSPSGKEATLSAQMFASVKVVLLPGIRPLLTIRMLVWMAAGISLFYFPAFFIGEYPGNEAWLGLVYTLVSLGGFMAGSLINVVLLSRVKGPINILWPAGLFFPLGTIAFAFITPNPAITTAIFVVWGFTFGLHITNCINLLYVFAGEKQSSAVFTDGAFQQVAALMGTTLGGLAIAIAPEFLGWKLLIAFIGLATLIPLILVVRQAKLSTAELVNG
jgi:predicted MFS family arabinose efflux permease